MRALQCVETMTRGDVPYLDIDKKTSLIIKNLAKLLILYSFKLLKWP